MLLNLYYVIPYKEILGLLSNSLLDDKTDNDFFATQAALWIYLLDNGMMKDTEYKYIAKIKTQINSATYKDYYMSQEIKRILN